MFEVGEEGNKFVMETVFPSPSNFIHLDFETMHCAVADLGGPLATTRKKGFIVEGKNQISLLTYSHIVFWTNTGKQLSTCPNMH